MARAAVIKAEEDIPEADRLDGFSHPRETRDLFGHEAAERRLAGAVATGRLHHGWLIVGPEGVGKATLAYRLATYLLADPQDRDLTQGGLAVSPGSRAASQIRALSHPNLLLIRRPYDPKTKKLTSTIPVDEVRRVRGFLSHHAGAGAWRAVIVDSADEMNPNAANALLKSLEEPPAQTVFLLISADPGRLLPTIRSRCQMLPLAPLAPPALRRAVNAACATAGSDPPGDQDWAQLESLSEGSVRRALGLSAAGGVALYERIASVISALPKVDWRAVHTLADEIQPAQAEQKFEMVFAHLLRLLARLIRAAASEQTDGVEGSLAARLMPAERLASWAALWETIVREKAEADLLNLDRKMLIIDTFARLEAVARGP